MTLMTPTSEPTVVVGLLPVHGDWFVQWFPDVDNLAGREGVPKASLAPVAMWAKLETGDIVPMICGDACLVLAGDAVGHYSIFEGRQAYRYIISRHEGVGAIEFPGSGDGVAVAFATDEDGHWVLWQTIYTEV